MNSEVVQWFIYITMEYKKRENLVYKYLAGETIQVSWTTFKNSQFPICINIANGYTKLIKSANISVYYESTSVPEKYIYDHTGPSSKGGRNKPKHSLPFSSIQ